jgi:hypothetical protein
VDTSGNIVYVTGGQQRPRAYTDAAWHAFEEAVVLRVDLSTHEVRRLFAYRSPPEACPDDRPSISFKCGSVVGDELVLCSGTEILSLNIATLNISNYISLPCFNDLHHVLALGKEHYLVVNTGLDMVLEAFADGSTGREWSVIGDSPWDRFSPDVDYRKIASTKPHLSHPNYVFLRDDEIWVTRFEQRDAICLTRKMQQIRIDVEGPHDGIRHGDSFFFTTVDGHVVEIDAVSLQTARVLDLNSIEPASAPLGWCRGLHVAGDRAWVGFSRLRPTRFRRNINWLRHDFRLNPAQRARPTRIACYDLRAEKLLHEIDFEPHGLNAVFSILQPAVQE